MQDGRVTLNALAVGFGPALWSNRECDLSRIVKLRAQGVMPLVTRMVIEGGEGPVGLRPLACSGCYQLGHTVNAEGTVDRVVFDAWVNLRGARDRLDGLGGHGGELIDVGRVYMEETFTRPHAPPGERKVLRLELEGVEPVPSARRVWTPFEAITALPDGAVWVDEMSPDAGVAQFGLGHTDWNQHVNSMVYPRLFEDAALRRLSALGHDTASRAARFCELGYRKPCFAGETHAIVQRVYARGDVLGVVGGFVPASARGDKAHCAVRMEF